LHTFLFLFQLSGVFFRVNGRRRESYEFGMVWRGTKVGKRRSREALGFGRSWSVLYGLQ
jgi:hypothetical protein